MRSITVVTEAISARPLPPRAGRTPSDRCFALPARGLLERLYTGLFQDWFVMATRKSPGIQIPSGRNNLGERLALVMQASRAIRCQLAITICESGEMRLASRQLRWDSRQTTQWIAARRHQLRPSNRQSSHSIALAIAQVLTSHGYCAFVAGQIEDTASIQ
jgi:hypothetical protein